VDVPGRLHPPRKDEAEFAAATMLYIHPEECIDCGACVPACPVAAIYEHRRDAEATSRIWSKPTPSPPWRRRHDGEGGSHVAKHVADHADIMAVPAAERQAAHARF
jgi:ferredoxin